MTFEIGKNLVRCAAMLAAVIVSADAFAQARPPAGGLLGNRLRNRTAAAGSPLTNVPAAGANAEGGDSAKTPNKEIPTFNWDAAPVDIVLQAYADQIDKTFLKDPAVPNVTISLKSREGQKLTQEEYLEAIEVVLEMNGIHIEPYGEKFIRVLPRKSARKEGIPIIMDSETKLADSGKVVSMMVQLKNISTEDGQKTLDNFKSDSGIIIGFERTNSILITDTEANINRMLEIIRTIDIATPVLENVFVRQIKNASAQDIKTALEAIVQESQKELEKSGGQNANIASQNNAQPRPFGSRLLGGNNANNKPAAPTPNSSLVMTVSDADRGMIRGKVLILADERSNKLIIVTQKPNMDFFDNVIEQLDIETTPDTVVKVYRLKYAEAEEVSDMINDLIGNAGGSRSSSKDNQNRNARNGTGSNLTRTSGTAANAQRKSANQRTGEAKAGELTKDNTTVLADKRINGLVVMTEKELVPTLESIIESMDIKLSQVLIETVIIEVSLGDGIETGMDWVQKGRKDKTVNATTASGSPLYHVQRTTTFENTATGEKTTTTSLLSDLVEGGYSHTTTETGDDWKQTITDISSSIAGKSTQVAYDGLANYYTAGTATGLGGGANNGALAYAAQGIASNVLGKAFNFVFDSEELGMSAILQMSKTDSHSKYIASPIIMTLDNKEATIDATQMRYLFKGYQYSGSSMYGSAVPDYEQKELGITIKVTPKINPNGTVMLTLEEEYSQEGAGQSITGQDGKPFVAATTVTRKMSADALLENNQTVIFAGLTETSQTEAEAGIPILKDIPWIGKWLFGSVSKNEARTELLVFMTPYVLDDADAAQAEAIRRKRAISDQHAWDDHGWSASALADPVSKKEQLRRLKEEWKKQDEEREAKVAIEQEKVKRVKALEKMSEKERKAWLEMHKDELKEEEREKLEEKMLDKDSQEELKKLAEDVKAKKLNEADKELDKTAKEYEQENEYNRLKREREEKAKAAAETSADEGNGAEQKPEAPKPETPAVPAQPAPETPAVPAQPAPETPAASAAEPNLLNVLAVEAVGGAAEAKPEEKAKE